MEKRQVRIFRCKRCRRAAPLGASICLHCGTSRPAGRPWHAPVMIALVVPIAYGLLMILLR